MDSNIEMRAQKCQKSLQKLKKHIEDSGGIEQFASVHDMIVDIIEALEDGKSIDELYALCDKLLDELNEYNDIDLAQHGRTIGSTVKKLKQKTDYQDFLQCLSQDQSSDDMAFWTRQSSSEDDSDFDVEAEWDKCCNIYVNGGDMDYALRFFTHLADNGINLACFYVAGIYKFGKNGTIDLQKAFQYFLKGAQDNDNLNGSSDCMFHLYWCYHNGEGVGKDEQKALYWLKKAADAEHGQAMNTLAYLYLYEDNQKANRAKGYDLSRRAYDKGVASAKLLTAYCYIFGFGVTANLQTAERLLIEARNEGVPDTKPYFDTIEKVRQELNNSSNSGRPSNSGQSSNSSQSGNSGDSSTGDSEKKGSNVTCGCIFWILLILGALYYFGALDFVTGLFEKSQEPMYVLAETMNLREEGNEQAERIGTAAYNTEVATYGEPGAWIKVKAGGKKGYMSAEGLVSKTEIDQLNSVWGDSEAREAVRELDYRHALIDFRQRVVEDENCKLYGADNNGGNIFKSTDRDLAGFAFIVDNKTTNERLAVIYIYDEEGNLLLENTDENVRQGQYIRALKRNKKGVYYLQYGSKSGKKAKQQNKQEVVNALGTEQNPQTTESQPAANEPTNDTPQQSTGFKLERVDGF
jgi:uncharacterized protein YgiM (DUF1202 family)